MGKKHYIQQGNKNNCGAYCTAYLLGEYLNRTKQGEQGDAEEEAQEKEQEQKICDHSWERINLAYMSSNPFKIRKYLSTEEYNAVITDKTNLANGFTVFPKIKLNGAGIEQHPLYHLLGTMQDDAEIEENPETYLETGIDDSFEYMIGVFRHVDDVEAEMQKPENQEEEPQDPGDYHYILIHRSEQGWEYINPHDGEWKPSPTPFTFAGKFILPDESEKNEGWKWMDFGLLIVKN